MTRQELYSFFIQGIRDDVYPGYDEFEGRCAYNTKDGHHCFFGHLGRECGIGLKEDASVNQQSEAHMTRLEEVTGLGIEHLVSLQRLHDKFAATNSGWDPVRVVHALNEHPVFQDVAQVDPKEFAE